MSLIVDAENTGTTEEMWSASVRLRELPPVVVPTTNRVLIVAPQADDEVFGAARLLQRPPGDLSAHRSACPHRREASHPLSAAACAIDLATVRTGAVVTSLRHLGWDQPEVTLGIPDGYIDAFEGDAAEAVRRRLDPGDLCLAPWSRDGHPDHDAAGRASKAVSDEVGATLLGFLVWAWHWADPIGPDLPWDRLAKLEFGRGERDAKCCAVRARRSQIRPLRPDPEDAFVLPQPVLRPFERDYQVYVLDQKGP